MNNSKAYRMPRRLKRTLTLQSTGDAHVDGKIRRIMISADKHYRDYKSRRAKTLDNVSTEES